MFSTKKGKRYQLFQRIIKKSQRKSRDAIVIVGEF